MTDATLTVLPSLRAGNVVRVHERVKDVTPKGEVRERVQIFEGLVTSLRGGGKSATMTVRKESDGFGVIKTFPVHSPMIAKVEVVKALRVRRAKLNFVTNFRRKLREVTKKK